MSKLRKGEIEILGEDERRQLQCFVRRVLKQLGFNPQQFHVDRSPSGKGMGKKYVLERTPVLLDLHRKQFCRTRSARFIIALDADRETIEEARVSIDKAVTDAGLAKIQPREGVVVLITRRSIENWLTFLEDLSANEEDEYKHRKDKEGEIGQAVSRFVGYVKNPDTMPWEALPSIQAAVEEFRRELLPVFS